MLSERLSVHPAALLARFRPDLTGGFPEPERAIGDDEPRRHLEPAPLQVEQQIAPVLRALAGAIGDGSKTLPSRARARRTSRHRLVPTGPHARVPVPVSSALSLLSTWMVLKGKGSRQNRTGRPDPHPRHGLTAPKCPATTAQGGSLATHNHGRAAKGRPDCGIDMVSFFNRA